MGVGSADVAPAPGADAVIQAGDHVDVVVAGGGVAGLVMARQLAHLGLAVTVVEQRAALGGFVARHELGGVQLDSGAESFATRKGTVAALATELGLGDDIVTPAPAGAWVAWEGGSAPLPAAGVLGIPGVPLADDVRRIIGWGGSLRAYLDRLMPLLRVRPEHDLGDIVRRRMGAKVLDRLVTPVVAGVHSADPSVVDVRTVAPGLTQAMTTQGSLSGAVMALREQAPAGSQVQGIAGGVYHLVEALEADARFYGVTFRTSTRVTHLERGDDDATYTLHLEPTAAADAGADAPAPETVRARAVVVATDFRAGLALLAQAGVGSAAAGATAALPGPAEWPEPASVTLATLVIDDARLDAHPRGSGVLVSAGTPGVAAKALTHSSAKWAWLAERLPAHRHVLRLSYGRRPAPAVGGAGAKAAQGEGGAPHVDLATALRDASTLLGVALAESDVVDFAVTTWNDSLAFATVGHKARVRQALAAVAEVPGLDVVGAWVSGTGLAATVEHARTTASGLAAELRGARRLDRED
ncbi:protoporphyrinogen/coproporphyrinogen oxidase [Herbiconiux liukaitaii]|uniref:protoporphyrinogen/coproporphyrinogen oxidase n=1 Tax=Herbiconiux liukaitaii TaxID=3342799 RepID=UPI0035B9B40D